MEWLQLLNPIVRFLTWAASPVSKHVAYPFKIDSNITALKSSLQKLDAAKTDVRNKIQNEDRGNGVPTEEAKLWLENVEAIERNAAEIDEKYQHLCRCICNISPNFWSSYKISKKATKKQAEMDNLCEQIKTIEVIIHMQPPLAPEVPASSSISPYLKSALDVIKDDQHSIIGIWGMGGVGKTHLLEQIHNELRGEFEVVVYVTCSKKCDEEKVQNKIINMLRLSKLGDSMEQKNNTIHNFLKERSFLLLLDDLWNRVNLKTIGIPSPMKAAGTCKRKVVLATRSAEVCKNMEARKKIKLDVLNSDDAWSLFKEKVTEETMLSDQLIEKYAEDAVKELGGLPLALITVGRAMSDKTDLSAWELAVVRLKQARLNDIQSSDEEHESVFHILKFSYDSLQKTDDDNNTLRQCFLHCSLWPEDYTIWKKDLIELWMGLGLIDEQEIQTTYNVGYDYIRRLQDVCLLEVSTESDDIIKMHDVIRDMALWIANNQGRDINKWIVQAGTYNEHQEIQVSCDTESLSVMNNDATNISFYFSCSSSNLSTLLLNQNRLNVSSIPQGELFSKLTCLNLSNNHLEIFPAEICKIIHLQYLNLSHNPLKSLPEELANLTNLKYLLLRGIQCTFPNKPYLSKLKYLRVVDLTDCSLDNSNVEIYPTLEEELRCLHDFQAIGITISSVQDFYELSQKGTMPVRWLDVYKYKGRCLSFSSFFFINSQLQSHLTSLKIRDAKEGVECIEFESTNETRSIYHHGRIEHLYFQAMWNLKEVIWKSLGPKNIFPRLEVLEFHFCLQLTSISWVLDLPRLRELIILYCTNIKQLICFEELENSGINVSQRSFPFLKRIILIQNFKLENYSDPMITFPALEILAVGACRKLKKLPFKTGDPPRKLKKIRGTERWWNNVEMEDDSHRSSLPFYMINM